MPLVPRIDDRLELRRDPSAEGRFRLIAPDGRDCGPMGESGRFLVLRLDGLTERDALKAAYGERFYQVLGDAELDSLLTHLHSEGLLVDDPRALRVLTRLRQNGITYRSVERDRRGEDRGDRRGPAAFARAFDAGIILLNEGYLGSAHARFKALSTTHPDDLRVQKILGHVEFELAREDQPELREDRRDVDWLAFDRALSEMLERGQCPSCDNELVVELGRTNHCVHCGASYTTYALKHRR